MILRPYQKNMIDRAEAALRKYGNTLAVAPTGAGKTIIIAALAGRLGGKQCVLQHRDELVGQNLRKFRDVNPGQGTGLYTVGCKDWRIDTTFAMVQTLARNLKSIPELDTLIIYEAHHAVANSYRNVVNAVLEKKTDCKIFGVTATPARGDGKGLRPIFSNCCEQISLHSLIAQGFLVRPRTYVCTLDGTDAKLAGLRKTASGEYDMQEAAEVLDLAVHNEAVVREWKKLAGGRRIIVFCSTVELTAHVTEAFHTGGVSAAVISGDLPGGERKALLDRFDRGGLQVVVNVAVLTKGYDSQPVSCIVLLHPCSCKSTMLQMIGRGLRTVDSQFYPEMIKTDCIIMDFGRSLVIHRDLESKVRMDDKQKLCPGCGADIPFGVMEYPICGHEFIAPGQISGGLNGEDGPELVSNVGMEEVDLLDSSPFCWCDLFGSGKVMIASGFEAWVSVCSSDGKRWLALGKVKKEREVRRLFVEERVQNLAAADDFLRMNESDDAAQKNRRWLNDPAIAKQWELLQRYGYGYGTMLAFTKYSSACTLNFFWNRGPIEREVLRG